MGKLSDLNLHGRPDNIRNERKSQLEKSPHRSLYLRQTVQKSHKTISVRAGFLFREYWTRALTCLVLESLRM